MTSREVPSTQFCQTYILFLTISSMMSMAFANLTLALRINSLWDQRAHINRIVIGVFIVTYSVTVASTILVSIKLRDQIYYDALVTKACIIPGKPKFWPGTWAGMVAFDVFVVSLLVLNALNKPYQHSSDIISELHQDGLKFFLALLALRFISLVFSVATGPAKAFLTVAFVWAMVSITLSRLLLRIRAIGARGQGVQVWIGNGFELTRYANSCVSP